MTMINGYTSCPQVYNLQIKFYNNMYTSTRHLRARQELCEPMVNIRRIWMSYPLVHQVRVFFQAEKATLQMPVVHFEGGDYAL